jgi:hypothetical protein
MDRPDFSEMDWASFQYCLADRLPMNPVVNGEEAIDKSVEELTSAIQGATAASGPKRRLRANLRRSLPDSIQDEFA